jgi:hypothetical protein
MHPGEKSRIFRPFSPTKPTPHHDAPIHGLAHVINRERRHRTSRHRFHLDTRLLKAINLHLHIDTVITHTKMHTEKGTKMITNEVQHRNTKAWLARFESSTAELETLSHPLPALGCSNFR